MSENESQFILAAYRPNGLDRDDPAMAEAVGTLASDPRRRAAFEHQLDFDRRVAAALAAIPTPADLRDSILAGARFSGAAHRSDTPPSPRTIPRTWLAAAAAVTVLAAVAAWWATRPGTDGTLVALDPAAQAAEWKRGSLALLDAVVAGTADFDLTGADPGATLAWLREEFGRDIPLPEALAALPSVGCACVEAGDGRLALVCLDAGDGTIVHLTIYDEPATDESDASLVASTPSRGAVETEGPWAFVAWRDDSRRYLLAAAADQPAARRRLCELLGIEEA